MTDPREFDDLAFKYFASGLTPPESERFQALLRERPELRRRFLQESVRVGAIGEWAAEQLVSSAPKPQGRATTRRIALAAAAAVLLAALVAVFARRPEKAPPDVVAVPAETPAPKPVAPPPTELPRRDPPPRPVVLPSEGKPTVPPAEPLPRPVPKPRPPAPSEETPVPPPIPPPPPEPKPVPPKEPVRTEVMIARIDEVQRDAVIVADGKKFKATANAGLPAGALLRTSGADAVVALVFPDKTRVVMGGDTEIAELRGDGGKQLTLVRGVTALDVTPQAQPFQIRTPYGTVTVVGTSLTIRSDSAQLRVDVEEGKVRLETPQGRSVIVSKDQSAEAAAGRDPLVKRIPPPDVVSDLVGHWKFDEASGNQAYDASPHRHHAAIDGATRVRGKSGAALRFDGVDDFVKLPRAPALDDLQEGDYTLSAWCSPAEPPRGARSILLGKVGFHIGLTYDDEKRFEMWHYLSSGADGGGVHARSGPGQAAGEFHHLAGVVSRSKGTTQIFVDGRLEGVTRWAPASAPRDYGGRGWTIGMARENNVPHGPAAAILDDVRIYSRALSPRDVATLAGAPYGALSRVR